MTDSASKQWVILELTRLGEKEKPEDLVSLIQGETGISDLEIFIPSTSFHRRDNWVTICLMEGYIFMEGGRRAGFYFDLEEIPYIARVLTRDEPTGRYIVYVPNEEVDKLKSRLRTQTLRDFGEGDTIEVIEGAYESLEGTVIDFNPETKHAFVKIHELVSLDTVVELPLQFLRKI